MSENLLWSFTFSLLLSLIAFNGNTEAFVMKMRPSSCSRKDPRICVGYVQNQDSVMGGELRYQKKILGQMGYRCKDAIVRPEICTTTTTSSTTSSCVDIVPTGISTMTYGLREAGSMLVREAERISAVVNEICDEVMRNPAVTCAPTVTASFKRKLKCPTEPFVCGSKNPKPCEKITISNIANRPAIKVRVYDDATPISIEEKPPTETSTLDTNPQPGMMQPKQEKGFLERMGDKLENAIRPDGQELNMQSSAAYPYQQRPVAGVENGGPNQQTQPFGGDTSNQAIPPMGDVNVIGGRSIANGAPNTGYTNTNPAMGSNSGGNLSQQQPIDSNVFNSNLSDPNTSHYDDVMDSKKSKLATNEQAVF